MEFYRGDRIAWPYIYTVDGLAVDITGYIFIFTINEEEYPTDNSLQIYQVEGELIFPLEGELSFLLTTDIEPKDYFYDIQVEKPNGNTRTLEKGKFTVIQDITKSGLDEGIVTEDEDPIWTEDNLIITEG